MPLREDVTYTLTFVGREYQELECQLMYVPAGETENILVVFRTLPFDTTGDLLLVAHRSILLDLKSRLGT